MTLIERFWQQVDKPTEDEKCWQWTGRPEGCGYGQIRAGGVKKMAHRVAYELLVGEIPTGLEVDHLCHNRTCVNPKHLRLQDRQQNCQNRRGSNRNSSTGVRGVYMRESGRYRVMVGHNRRTYHGGTFDTINEAEQVAISLRLRLHTNNLIDRGLSVRGEQ